MSEEKVGPVVDAPGKNKAPDWGASYGLSELWTEVKDGLWVGGTKDEDVIGYGREGWVSRFDGMFHVTDEAEITTEDFNSVVTLYADARPVDWEVEEYRWGIYDSSGQNIELDDIRDVVKWAHKRWKSGKQVLIRCQAGLSRSPFITALVLIRDGLEIQEAIDLIRRQRSEHCLSLNGSSKRGQFTRILHDTPVEYWRD